MQLCVFYTQSFILLSEDRTESRKSRENSLGRGMMNWMCRTKGSPWPSICRSCLLKWNKHSRTLLVPCFLACFGCKTRILLRNLLKQSTRLNHYCHCPSSKRWCPRIKKCWQPYNLIRFFEVLEKKLVRLCDRRKFGPCPLHQLVFWSLWSKYPILNHCRTWLRRLERGSLQSAISAKILRSKFGKFRSLWNSVLLEH